MTLPQKLIELLNRSASFQYNAIKTTPYEIDYIFQGKCYSIEDVLSVSSGDTSYDIIFDTTAVTSDLVALPTSWATTAGDVTINLGACTSYADGTLVLPQNRLYSGDASVVTFTYNATPTGYVAGSTNILVGSSSTNQNSGGGNSRGSLPIILQTGLKYVFRVSNNSGENIKLGIGIYWYEV